MTNELQEVNNQSPRPVMRRFTRQRAVILDVIRRNGHLDADDIYQKARQRESNISLSTVYRSVEVFVKENLVVERRFGRSGRRYYEIAKPADHYHLFCLGCGAIFELPCTLNNRIEEYANTANSFRVTGIELSLEGYCSSCHHIRQSIEENTNLRRSGDGRNTIEQTEER